MPHLGTVIRWEGDFGFIQHDETLVSYFVHMHGVEGACRLTPGDKVSFELERTKSKRVQAVRVRKLAALPKAD